MALAETDHELETTLNIPATEMMLPIDDIIIRHLTQRYVGHCERQCLVTEVKSIIQRSSVRMSKARLDGSGDVSVRFQVSGNVLNPHDLLVGCVIKNVTGNNVTCAHPKVTLTIDAPFIARLLRVGNAITAEVREASYPLGSETITASGVLFRNEPKTVIFGTEHPSKAETTPELLQLLQRSLARLGDARRMYQSAPAKRRDYFQAMYYSYDSPLVETALPKGVTLVKVSNIAMELLETGKAGLRDYGEEVRLVSHALLDPALGMIFQVDPKVVSIDPIKGPEVFEFQDLGNPVYVRKNLVSLLCQLLDEETRYVRMIVEMAHFYVEDEVFERDTKVWTKLDERRVPQPTRRKK